MAEAEYTPPAVWTWDPGNGGPFASINRPTAGAQVERELPVGTHPFQLYSLGTPNGQKVTILLEELLEAGHAGAVEARGGRIVRPAAADRQEERAADADQAADRRRGGKAQVEAGPGRTRHGTAGPGGGGIRTGLRGFGERICGAGRAG